MVSVTDFAHAMYKGFWIELSRSERARDTCMRSETARAIKERFIAGDTVGDGIRALRELTICAQNTDGTGPVIAGVLDYVGESVRSADEARHAGRQYCDALHAIHEARMPARIAVKLSQLGMDVDLTLCRDIVGAVADDARSYGIGIEIDAEEASRAQRTFDIFRELHHQGYDITLALQAARKKSFGDAHVLSARGGQVRLAKGAYRETAEDAYQQPGQISHQYVELMNILFHGCRKVIVASHDDAMIDAARRMVDAGGIEKERLEIDMLYGIREHRLIELARHGYQTGVYIPFGQAWWPYVCRRIGERPANMLFVARSILSSNGRRIAPSGR